ncbi:hypothetical protein F5Y15DRAFT_404983 [Xylariaceae sp. FL0016]|nr:hypothetical protein F5Y15DRAFT_404983 [Xylariaceae sp. FL0016]
MPSLRSIIAVTALLANGIHAHFTVQLPPTVGAFKDDDEGDAPCGGYSPDLSTINTSDFHVKGDAIATTSTHPRTNWLYRITIDSTPTGNWTQIHEIIQQTGAGQYCTPDVTVPSEYVGKKAILSIVASGPDGLLYQCSAVNFVDGTASISDGCTNSSSVTGSPTTDDALTALVGTNVSSTTTASETPNTAMILRESSVNGLGSLLTAGLMIVVGFVLAM